MAAVGDALVAIRSLSTRCPAGRTQAADACSITRRFPVGTEVSTPAAAIAPGGETKNPSTAKGCIKDSLDTALSGEAAVPSPVRVLSCVTFVRAFGAATVIVLPAELTVMFAPPASSRSPFNPFRLLTTLVGAI